MVNLMMFITDPPKRNVLQSSYYTIVKNKKYRNNESIAKPLLLKLNISFSFTRFKTCKRIHSKVKPAHQ